VSQSTLVEVIRALGILSRIATEIAPLLDGKREESDVRQLLRQVVAMSSATGSKVDLADHIARAKQAITGEHGHQLAAELAAELELTVMQAGPGPALAALRGARTKAGRG
jgi:hypothetical protein